MKNPHEETFAMIKSMKTDDMINIRSIYSLADLGWGKGRPPPEGKKTVVEKLGYFPELYKMKDILEICIRKSFTKISLRFSNGNSNIFSKLSDMH